MSACAIQPAEPRRALLWRAAQLTIPAAVAPTGVTATERRRRAIVELVIDAAMIGAIIPAAPRIVTAMIVKTWWQRCRILPIRLQHRHGRKVQCARDRGRRIWHSRESRDDERQHGAKALFRTSRSLQICCHQSVILHVRRLFRTGQQARCSKPPIRQRPRIASTAAWPGTRL